MKLFVLIPATLAQLNRDNVFCKDNFLACPSYKKNCAVSSKLQDMCQKTCGTCTELSARSVMRLDECKDEWAVCETINPKQCTDDSVKAACRKKCNACEETIRPADNTCHEPNWCATTFLGHCTEPEMAAAKAKYGKYCPIECKHPSCEFEWGAKMNGAKKDMDGCRDVSNICLELIETLPDMCGQHQALMTHFCQKSCNRCDVIVADVASVTKLDCVDYQTNCDTQSLLEKALRLPIKDCAAPREDEPLLAKQRKLRYQGLCRKTCNQCDDVIFKSDVVESAPSKHDPICGDPIRPDCDQLEPICAAQPDRCPFGCTLCKKTPDLLELLIPKSARCVDKKKGCQKWRCGHKKYKNWMNKYCAKTCNSCE